MKRAIGLILILAICFTFAACNSENTDENITEPDATQSAFAEFGTTPTVYAVVSNENPTVGEEVTVTVKLCNAGLLASVDLVAGYDSSSLMVKHTGGGSIPDIRDMTKVEDGTITYGGFVMQAAAVEDETLFVLTITPQPGTAGPQTIQINCVNFLVARDASGNETDDLTSHLQTKNIVLNVQ